jgi:predicted metalloprotease with PDZ domain
MVSEQKYLDHPHAGDWTFSQEEARNAELKKEGMGTHDPGSLARTRGVVVSLTLDATIARLTGGERRLTDLMGMIYRWSSPEHGRIAVTRNANLMAVCSAVTGGEYLDEFFQSLVFSTDPPPTAAALADILNREGGN